MSERLAERLTTANNEKPDLFETAGRLPLEGSKEFSSVGWDSSRHGTTFPAYVSELADDPVARAEFTTGAQALGLATDRKPLNPQQFVIADVLAGPESLFGICIPRRASKTTSLFAVALGRCLSREDYQVAFTAQSGVKARDRFLKDVVVPLERTYGETELFKINRSRGGEHIRFANGSLLTVLPPIPESFRGDSFDLVIADESQEHEPDLSAELLGAILPTFDTRPGAQLVVAGTAGEHRSGLLWDTLEQLRKGLAGGVEYAAADTTPVHTGEPDEPVEGTTADPAVWQSAHPGIGNLTPLSAVERNYRALPHAQFAREYLGLWPLSAGSRLFAAEKWEALAVAGDLTPPERFALAFAVDGEGRAGAIALAWRDSEGLAHVGINRYSQGTEWLGVDVLRLSRKYKTAIAYDKSRAEAQLTAEGLERKSPRPRLAARGWPELSNAAALFLREFESGKLRHYAQDDLTRAVQSATKSGTYASNRWNYRPPKGGGDIAALDAAALALHNYDAQFSKPKSTFIDLSQIT